MTSRPFRFRFVAAVVLAVVTVAPAAMANPQYHRPSCHLAESTSSSQLVGYYPNGPQGGRRWVTLAQAKAAIESGCGGCSLTAI